MNKRELQSEVMRLRAQQLRARNNEVFGGLSSEERAAYNIRSDRIRELDAEIEASTLADDASAAQRSKWNTSSETDTPQDESRQPYRDRERDSSRAFTDFVKTDQSQPKTGTKRID